MSDPNAKLVYMANQIATFFLTQPAAGAAEGVPRISTNIGSRACAASSSSISRMAVKG